MAHINVGSVRTALGRAVGRLDQGRRYLAPHRCGIVNDELRRLLRPSEVKLVEQLGVPDRVHLLAVYQCLKRAGYRNADLLKAALLHDVGKADGHLCVGLPHRSLAVVLHVGSPRLLAWLAAAPGSGWRRPFYLAVQHSALGARLARDAGCSERVCWLIEHHHDIDTHGDTELQALQRADEGRSW